MSEDMVPYVTQATTQKRMTKTEERQAVDRFAKVEHARRFLLLDMFERQAHITAGFPTFEEYCHVRLNIDYDKSYLSRTLQAARVERSVTGVSFHTLKLDEIKNSGITFRVAAEIAKAPEEKWGSLFTKFTAITKGDSYTTKSALTELKRLVNAAMPPVLEPAKVEPDAPAEPEKSRNDMTPIVPPVYDGTPEQVAAESEDEVHDEPTADVETTSGEEESEETPQVEASDPDEDQSPAKLDAAKAPVRLEPFGDIMLRQFECTVTFLRSFVACYAGSDQDGMLELYTDVKKFLAEANL